MHPQRIGSILNPDRHARDQPFGQSAQLPSVQWHNVELPNSCDQNLFLCTSHDQSPRRYSKGTPSAHPISLSRHYRDQVSETLEPTGSQRLPQTGIAQGPGHYGRASPKWYCSACCDKKYRRAQELKRHIRDKHRLPQKCPFCHTQWTRPERIKAHLINDHSDRFTEEAQGDIRHLRGQKDTIRFLEKYGATRHASSNIRTGGAAVPEQPILLSTFLGYQQWD
jgi:hypothetical protein